MTHWETGNVGLESLQQSHDGDGLRPKKVMNGVGKPPWQPHASRSWR